MAHQVTVFLAEDALIALEDHFSDKDDDALRKFVFDQVKIISRNAKLIRMNKLFTGKIEVKGGEPDETKLETWHLKDVNLDKFELDEDPDWIPKRMDKKNTKSYSIKIGDKTWDGLQLFAKVHLARIKFYNDSLTESDKNYKDKFIEKTICFEQVIHEAILPGVFEKIAENIDKELDDEFDKINEPPKPKKEKKKKKK